MTKHKCYIAGPMSGIKDHNRKAFLDAEDFLRAIDSIESIFNPITSEASLLVQSGQVRDTKEAYRMCMALDCEWICKEATMLYMLKGWEYSKGAKAEHALAICLGLEIVYQ